MSRRIIQDIISRVIRTPHHDEEDRGKRKIWVSIFFVITCSILVLGLFLLFSSSLSHVSVKVATTRKDINLDELIFLNKDEAGGGIKYTIMNFEGSESSKVPVTGSRTISKLATGNVTIYNSYSPASQKLVTGTRLETKDGKIYKIANPVTVPGTSVLGSKILPGTIDVAVTASLPGVKYNIPPTEFTIPGLKGGPKYQKFYAKSKKDILGGFSGEIKISSPADLQKARSNLQETIRQKLTKNALVQVPKGFLLYEDALFLNFKDNTVDGSSLVETALEPGSLKVTGVLNALIIDEDSLKKFVINKKLPDSDDNAKIIVSDLNKINLRILNKEKTNINGSDAILARVTGKLSLIWDFDDNVLKGKLVGIKKSKYQSVFKDFPVIEKAEAIFSPSWALYFPSDIKRIQITKELDLK